MHGDPQDQFGDWRDQLSMYDRATWPERMKAEVDAGAEPERVMHRCFSNAALYADPVRTKFAAGMGKEFRGVTKLAPATVNAELRQFEGWATRPELDRTDEIVLHKGVRYKNPTVLLLHHDHRLPVGQVDFVPKAEGIWFRAKLPTIEAPGELRERVEGAWEAVKARLITSVSVGFRALESERRPDGVLVYTKSELFELSLVTVPALESAQIDPATIKGMGATSTGQRDRSAVALPHGLTKEQEQDLLIAQANRVLGKNATSPATMVTLHVAVARQRSFNETTAQVILAMDERLKKLEARK